MRQNSRCIDEIILIMSMYCNTWKKKYESKREHDSLVAQYICILSFSLHRCDSTDVPADVTLVDHGNITTRRSHLCTEQLTLPEKCQILTAQITTGVLGTTMMDK